MNYYPFTPLLDTYTLLKPALFYLEVMFFNSLIWGMLYSTMIHDQ